MNTSSDIWPPTHHHNSHSRITSSTTDSSISTSSPSTAARPSSLVHQHKQKADPIFGTLPFFEQWVSYSTHWLWANMRDAAKAAHRDLDDDKDSGWCALRHGDFDSGRIFLWHDPSSYAIWEDKIALKLAQQQWHPMASCAKRTRRAADALERQRIADQRRMRTAARVAIDAAALAAIVSIHAREAAFRALQERIEKEAALARAFRANKRAATVAYEAGISAAEQAWHAAIALLLLVCDQAGRSASAHAARASAGVATIAAGQASVLAISRSKSANGAVAYLVARDRAERNACEAATEAVEESAGRYRRALDIVHKLERVLVAEAVCVKVGQQAAVYALELSSRIVLLVAAIAMRVRASQAATAAMSAVTVVNACAAVARAHVVAAAVVRAMFGRRYEQGALGEPNGSSCGLQCQEYHVPVRYGVGGGCSGLLLKADSLGGLPHNHLSFRINSTAIFWVAEAAAHDARRVMVSRKRAAKRAVAVAAACSWLAGIAARRSAVDAAEATLVGARQVVQDEHSAYFRSMARQKAEGTEGGKHLHGSKGVAVGKNVKVKSSCGVRAAKADGRVIAALVDIERLQKRQKEHMEVVLEDNLKRAVEREGHMETMLNSVAREEYHAVRAGDGTYLRGVLEQNRKEGMRSPRRWVRRLESLQQLHAAAREADARRVRQLAEEHRFVVLHKLRPHRRFLALQELAHRWSAEDVWVLGKGTGSGIDLSCFSDTSTNTGGYAESAGSTNESLVSTLGLSSQVRTQTGTARRLPAKRSTDATMELHNQAANLTPQHLALKTNSHERLPHWGVTTILSQNSFLQALGAIHASFEFWLILCGFQESSGILWSMSLCARQNRCLPHKRATAVLIYLEDGRSTG